MAIEKAALEELLGEGESAEEEAVKAPLFSNQLQKLGFQNDGIANVFIVTGNVHDFYLVNAEDEETKKPVVRFSLLHRCLALYFDTREFDIIASYDRGGWQFDNVEHMNATVEIFRSMSDDSDDLNQAAERVANGEGGQLPTRPTRAFDLIGEMVSRTEPDSSTPPSTREKHKSVAVFVHYSEAILSAPGWGRPNSADTDAIVIKILKWARFAKKMDFAIILVCDDTAGLHPALLSPESHIEVIRLPYPDRKLRKKYIRRWSAVKRPKFRGDDDVINRFAAASAGLNLRMIEDILIKAKTTGAVDFQFVAERKKDIIYKSFNEVVELPTPKFGREMLGGLEYILKVLDNDVIRPMNTGRIRRCPMGVLLAGAPGTGKSAIAEAIAKETSANFVVMRMSKLLSMWVGDTEQRLDRFLMVLQSLTPTICYIDEVDGAFVQRGAYQGDSGVSSRILTRMLEFMGDTSHRGEIVFLVNSNLPNLMDPAMRRAGRLDIKLAVLPPEEASERIPIFEALFRKHDVKYKGSLERPAERAEFFMGADIENAIRKAVAIADDDDRPEGLITEKDLMKAVTVTRPSVPPAAVEFYTALAVRECSDLSVLPRKYRDRWSSEDQDRIIEAGIIKFRPSGQGGA